MTKPVRKKKKKRKKKKYFEFLTPNQIEIHSHAFGEQEAF